MSVTICSLGDNSKANTEKLNLKETLHVFSWSIVHHSGVRVFSHHVINRLHDV